MSRCPRSWCWVATLLMLLGPLGEAVYASPEPKLNCPAPTRRPWKMKSPGGRFTLVQRVENGEERGVPELYVLELMRGSSFVWQLVLKDPLDMRHVWIAPEGGYVLLLRNEDELTLIGPGGQELGKWAMREQFSEGERVRIPQEPFCRAPQWVTNPKFEGSSFVVEVPTGLLSSDPAASRRTRVRINLKEAKLSREGEQLVQQDEELIQAFEAATAPEVRLRLADELLGRSQVKERVKGKELQAFWKKLVQAEEVSPKALHWMAVEAIGAIGTEGEARALARLPGMIEVRDLAVLELLIRKLPGEAGDYALRVLEERHPGLSVRKRALEFLKGRGGPAEAIADEFALRDESAELRQLGLQSLLQPPITEPRFQQTLGFCQDPDPFIRYQVIRFTLGVVLDGVTEPARQGLIEVLRRSEQQSQLAGCPDLVLALGSIADKAGQRARALELYARGLRGYQGLPPNSRLASPELRWEAMLQLALEAEKKAERAEAERYARELLADASSYGPICAPRPHVVLESNVPCSGARKAEKTAREVLGRLKSRGRGASAPSAPGRAP